MKKTRKRDEPGDEQHPISALPEPQTPTGWTFLTNHAHVLLCLYDRSDQRLRDVATEVGITERMVQRVVAELVDAGYLRIAKEGRRNRYTIDTSLRLRHPRELQKTIGDLLAALSSLTGKH